MEKVFWHALVNLCSGIYDLICYVFDIFYYLCGIQLFTDNDYSAIVQKVYIILGLVMMFVLTYSLLKAVINPDQFAKGENSFPKLIQNVVVSIVIIAILPTVFNIAFNFQNSLLKYEVIPKLILGNVDGTSSDGTNTPKITADGVEVSGGRGIAYYTFKSFFTPNLDDDCMDNVDTCRTEIKSNSGIVLADADKTVLQGKTFGYYSIFDKQMAKDEVSFNFLMALVAGVFILYVLLNFCFDMALRVIKLAFYQIIAPIPVICRIIPGGKLKDVFSKWTKQVISLFVEVFVRIAALTLGVYLISLIVQKYDAGLPGIGVLSWGQKNVVIALLIMSVVIFIKQIPKLIGDLFGLDTGGMKLGLMDKLAQGGGLMAASAVGGTGLGMIRNFAKSRREGNGFLSSAGRALTGGLSAGIGAAYGARGAKNFNDLKKATSQGLSNQMARRDKIERYISKRQNEKGGVLGAVFSDFGDWLTGKSVEDLDRIVTASGEVNSANDNFRNAAKKQWDKHSTDGNIVYNSDNNFFKGAGSDRMFELYKQYKTTDGRGNTIMRSASDIRNDIEQRKNNMKNRTFDSYLEQEMNRISISAPNRDNYYSTLTDASGNRIFDENAYNRALNDYNAAVTNAESTARSNYDRDISDLSYLDAMYAQLEKKSITEIGNAALRGQDIGSITSEDLYTTRELGQTAERIIRDSGLDQIDPAKDEGNQTVSVENGNVAKFIDDMASAASNQATHASLAKQNYLDKKKKS